MAVVALTVIGLMSSLGQVAHADRVSNEALNELVDGFEFGMTRVQVMAKIRRDVKARYEKRIFATSDVYQQDKLRREQEQEIDRIESSFIEFDGTVSGWDVSVIDDQFVQKVGESMMVYWESGLNDVKQRRFFFFQDDRMYKMVLTLDVSILDKSKRTFDRFRPVLEQRYGSAREHPSGLVWVVDDYIMFALDKLLHYDTICLVVADRGMSRKVLALRAKREKKVERKNPIIESMIGDGEVDIDKGADTIDRILDKK